MNSFTQVHVAISLAAIVAGFVVAVGLARGRFCSGWNAVFLAMTLTTSVTGFFFPFHGVTPALVLGVISTTLLLVAYFALHARKLAGGWRGTFVVTAVLAQYFNCFVLVVQSFQKIAPLHALAPTQKEPPFAIAQGTVLTLFVVLGIIAFKKFRSPALQPAFA
ncbi:MAG: hypothetical protein JWM88_2288 [Verrucomicrobia bacterium]|nr:hypothetical protein [Verrucomicrobiota bacterium]